MEYLIPVVLLVVVAGFVVFVLIKPGKEKKA